MKNEETLAVMALASAAMIGDAFQPRERGGSLREAIERGADKSYRKQRNKKKRIAKQSRKRNR